MKGEMIPYFIGYLFVFLYALGFFVDAMEKWKSRDSEIQDKVMIQLFISGIIVAICLLIAAVTMMAEIAAHIAQEPCFWCLWH